MTCVVCGAVAWWGVLRRLFRAWLRRVRRFVCRDGRGDRLRGRRFGEGPATAGRGYPLAGRHWRMCACLIGSSSSRVHLGRHSPRCCVRFLWFPCSRCRGLSATRVVGRMRRARFPPSSEDHRSLFPRVELFSESRTRSLRRCSRSSQPWVPSEASSASSVNLSSTSHAICLLNARR